MGRAHGTLITLWSCASTAGNGSDCAIAAFDVDFSVTA